MEDTPFIPPPAAEHHHRLLRPVLASAAGMLLVAGCSGEMPHALQDSSPSLTKTHPSPSQAHHSTTSPPDKACLSPRVTVFPYQHLKESNRDDVARQLSVLTKAHQQNVYVTARDIVNAGAIVADSLSDPVYAQAFTFANNHNTQSVSAKDLLAADFSKAAVNCLQRDQLQQTGQLYDTLIDGLAPKVGHQLSAAGEVAYDGLKSAYQQFKQKYHQELGH